MNIPQAVRAHSPTELFMGWGGNESYRISYMELRYQCACAGCVDEHSGVRTLQRESIDPLIRPLSVEPVGRYALLIRWSDGHDTGYYHYDRLFELCKTQGHALP